MGDSWQIFVVRGGLSGDVHSCCHTQLFMTEQLTEIVKSLILYWVLLLVKSSRTNWVWLLIVKSSHAILGLVDICSLSIQNSLTLTWNGMR